MGILESTFLIITCIFRMIVIHIPSLIILISIQAVVYRITKISIYNEIKSLIARGI